MIFFFFGAILHEFTWKLRNWFLFEDHLFNHEDFLPKILRIVVHHKNSINLFASLVFMASTLKIILLLVVLLSNQCLCSNWSSFLFHCCGCQELEKGVGICLFSKSEHHIPSPSRSWGNQMGIGFVY